MRFVAKQQFMRIPILGHALRFTGNIRVVCTETKGDVERIHAGMDRRDPEVSILFFAEGTRSRDRTFDAVAALRARARQRLRAIGNDPGGID
jgi:1-acyl-sn-glycerol-3-phosphate acyltransferase